MASGVDIEQLHLFQKRASGSLYAAFKLSYRNILIADHGYVSCHGRIFGQRSVLRYGALGGVYSVKQQLCGVHIGVYAIVCRHCWVYLSKYADIFSSRIDLSAAAGVI